MFENLETRMLLAVVGIDYTNITINAPAGAGTPATGVEQRLEITTGRDGGGNMIDNPRQRIFRFNLGTASPLEIRLSAELTPLSELNGADRATSFRFGLYRDTDGNDAFDENVDAQIAGFPTTILVSDLVKIGKSNNLAAGKYLAVLTPLQQETQGSNIHNVDAQLVFTTVPGTTPLASFPNATQNDIVTDSKGTTHLAFYDPAGKRLKYVRRSKAGTWGPVKSIDDSSGVGQYVSIALNNAGDPAVAYYDATNANLMYARFNQQAWIIEEVETAGKVGLYPSLVFVNNVPAVTYYQSGTRDLKFAKRSTNNDTWATSFIDKNDDSGRYSSLAIIPGTSTLAVAYENTTKGQFWYAKQSGTSWTKELIDDTEKGGGFTSLVFDNNKRPAISYYDAFNADLKFAQHNGTSWVKKVVAAKNTQGQFTNLWFNSSNAANIYYYNKTSNTAMLAVAKKKAFTFTPVQSGGGREMKLSVFGTTKVITYLDSASNQLGSRQV